MDTRSENRPMAHGLLERGRRRTPLESGTLSTSSESSSDLGAMTVVTGGSTDKARDGVSIEALFWAVEVCFQEEKLPDRRLLADWERRSKLVRLLSEDTEGLYAFVALPGV